MLGGGAFTYPKYVLAHHLETLILDVVEPDTSMEQIAVADFFLDEARAQFDQMESRLHVFNKPAHKFLKQRAKLISKLDSRTQDFEKYGVIINDAFSGSVACSELLRINTLEHSKQCLTSDGIYVLNLSDVGIDKSELKATMDTLGFVFEYVHVLPCADEVFGGAKPAVLVATDAEYSFPGESLVQRYGR